VAPVAAETMESLDKVNSGKALAKKLLMLKFLVSLLLAKESYKNTVLVEGSLFNSIPKDFSMLLVLMMLADL